MSQPTMRRPAQVFWTGRVQKYCQWSGRPITTQFVDGKTPGGPWAFLHPEVFASFGFTPGTSFGQLYEKQSNDRWLKIAGQMTQIPEVGRRIRLLEMDDPDPISFGSIGLVNKVQRVGTWWSIEVKWDCGRKLNLSVPPDIWEYIK